MKSLSCVAALACLSVALLACYGCQSSRAEVEQPAPESASALLSRLNNFYRAAKSFSATVSYQVNADGSDEAAYSDLRTVRFARPNRVSVTPLEDAEGAYVSDGRQVVALMKSMGRCVVQDAGRDVQELLDDPACLAMGPGRTIVQFGAESPLSLDAKEAEGVSLAGASQVDGHTCDQLKIESEHLIVIVHVQRGAEPLVRRIEYQMRQTDGVEASPRQLPVMNLTDWTVDQPLGSEAFALPDTEGLEQVESFTQVDLVANAEPHPLLGHAPPDVSLEDASGVARLLSSHVGKQAVVIDFWASWCAPCIESLPDLAKVAGDFANRPVAFYTVNSGDDRETIDAVLKERKIELPVTLDADGELSEQFSADAIPQTVLIDKQGVVQIVLTGAGGDHAGRLTRTIERVLSGEQLAEQILQAAAEHPDPTGPLEFPPGALTETDVQEAKLAFNLATMVDAYREHGRRDAAWDEPAEAALREAARHFAKDAGYLSQQAIAAQAKEVIDLGCDDPLVSYVYGAMLQDSDASDRAQQEAGEVVERSYQGLVELGYPANRRYAAANRAWRRHRYTTHNNEKQAHWSQFRYDEALAMVSQDDLSNHQGRFLIGGVFAVVNGLCEEDRTAFYDAAMQVKDDQPFMANLVGGAHHMKLAWEARGGGWASSVTKEGWRGFEKHVGIAREHYLAAWKAAPDRPDAATEMITVAMASSDDHASEMRLWFNRATAAQVDYLDAYDKFRFGLSPRWHGSFRTLLQFAERCKETERYDTDVPFAYCKVVLGISADSQNPLGLKTFARPGIYENFHEVCQRYASDDRKPWDDDWWKTLDLGAAYCAERWPEAAALLDDLDEQLDADALGRFPLERDEVVGAVRLHASERGEQLQELFALPAAEGAADQIERLEEFQQDEQLHELLRRRCASRVQQLRWLEQFYAGGETKLEADEQLTGWRKALGRWTRDEEGRLQGVSEYGGPLVVCEAEFGPRWELSGRIEYGKSPYNPWDAGVYVCVEGEPKLAIMHNPTEAWVAAGDVADLSSNHEPYEAEGDTSRLRVRYDDGLVDFWIGDTRVISGKRLPSLSNPDGVQIGVGAKYTWAGSTLRFSELTIKPLDKSL